MRHRYRFGGLVTVIAAALVAGLLGPATATAAGATERAKTERAKTGRATPVEFAVGKREVVLVDESRPTDANRTYPGAPTRTLPVLVLYPTTGAPGGPSQPDAKPARRAGPFPLVVFSHGFTASGPAYGEVLLRRIAAHGYVVAAPTYPLSNGAAPGGPKLVDYLNQPADVSFVITKMLAANRRDGALHDLLDPKRVGAMGHSLGAITTLGVTYNRCCLDPRIKAAVPISGIKLPFGSSSWAWPAVPLLLIHGDDDGTVPFVGSTNAFSEATAPKFLVTLLNGPHTPLGAPFLDVIVNSAHDFLDRYLKDERGSLARLERDANIPLVSTLQADPR